MMKEVQTEIELSISSLQQNTNEINSWVQEAVEEQQRLMLARSRIHGNSNNPFQNTEVIRIKKS